MAAKTKHGKVCPRHPELKGLRYYLTLNCVACSKEHAARSKAKRESLRLLHSSTVYTEPKE